MAYNYTSPYTNPYTYPYQTTTVPSGYSVTSSPIQTTTITPSAIGSIQVPKVAGREGARSYPLAPNSSILLADDTQDSVIWLKMTDGSGNASVVGYYTTPLEDLERQQADTKMQQLEDRLVSLEQKLDNFSQNKNHNQRTYKAPDNNKQQ